MNIIEAYEEINQVKDRKRDYFFCSDLGKCHRATIFKMMGRKRKPYTIGELNRFKSGEMTQRNWEYSWRRKSILLASEIYLPSMLGTDRFHGRIDDLLYNLTFDDNFFKKCNVYDPYKFLKTVKSSDIILLEFKTARSIFFNYAEDMLRETHKLQTWFYTLHIIQYMKSLKIRRYPLVLYVDRDGVNKPVLFVLDKPTLKKNYSILKEAMTSLVKDYVFYKKKKILPNILPRDIKKLKKKVKNEIQYKIQLKTNWECSYCKYQKICKLPKQKLQTNIIGTFKENKFEPNKNYEKFKDEIDKDKLKLLIDEIKEKKWKI